MDPALTRQDVMDRLREGEAVIRSLGVARLGLFGSFRRDAAGPASDVDLLVEFVPGQKSFERFDALACWLEDRLRRPVDVVTPEALSPYIGPRILADVEYVV